MPQPDWEELERRITRLEKLMGVEELPTPTPALAASAPPETAIEPAVNPTALLPVLGRALLGLAGYLGGYASSIQRLPDPSIESILLPFVDPVTVAALAACAGVTLLLIAMSQVHRQKPTAMGR